MNHDFEFCVLHVKVLTQLSNTYEIKENNERQVLSQVIENPYLDLLVFRERGV